MRGPRASLSLRDAPMNDVRRSLSLGDARLVAVCAFAPDLDSTFSATEPC
jgi:hypothetical protein